MMLFTLPKNSFVQKMRRKRQHKNFIYDSIIYYHNQALKSLAKISHNPHPIEKIRKSPKKPFVICRMSQEDLHLLQSAKKKFALCNKYKAYYKLLIF